MATVELEVRTHTYQEHQNPHMRCLACWVPVPRWHDGELCGCEIGSWNEPCHHVVPAVSACQTWTPDAGCTCPEGEHP